MPTLRPRVFGGKSSNGPEHTATRRLVRAGPFRLPCSELFPNAIGVIDKTREAQAVSLGAQTPQAGLMSDYVHCGP
jgi:hypothetical protein